MAGRPDLLVRSGVQRLVIGFLAYVPLLLNDPGRVAADTKAYLYLDPVRLLAGAPYMWQPELGMGTVTHQNIGYLWPIGPFYVLGEGLGLPDWVVQRLWLGSILLLAGLGMRWFLRTIGWKGSGLLVASLQSLQAYLQHDRSLTYPAEYRLAFRELGLAIGLEAIRKMKQKVREPFSRFLPLGEEIVAFWSDDAHRENSTWQEHIDINSVMLATALAPDGYLGGTP